MLTFQSIQSMPYALAQFPYRGVHRQQRRAFLVVRARVIGFLQPVPTPTRRAAAVSTARRLGRAARRARGSTADPFATARRSLWPRPPHRAVGTCLGDGAPRTGNCEEGAEYAGAVFARVMTPANFDRGGPIPSRGNHIASASQGQKAPCGINLLLVPSAAPFSRTHKHFHQTSAHAQLNETSVSST